MPNLTSFSALLYNGCIEHIQWSIDRKGAILRTYPHPRVFSSTQSRVQMIDQVDYESQKLGKYRLTCLLGKGSFGDV